MDDVEGHPAGPSSNGRNLCKTSIGGGATPKRPAEQSTGMDTQ